MVGHNGHRFEENGSTIGWMCGVTLRGKIPVIEHTVEALEVLSCSRLRWFVHVKRKAKDD